MEPSKEAIGVRLARLYNQIFDKSAAASESASGLKKPLNTENLLDALVVLYDECNSDTLKRSDEHIAKFVEKYRVVLSEIKQLRVNISDFEVKDIIGRGHFGEVHVVREKHTGDVFAMKTLRKDAMLKHKDNMFYEVEKDIMVLSKSEWLIKLHYTFQDSAQLYLVMEFCPGGNLAGFLDRRGQPLMESEASFYTAELCQALNTLHGIGYVYRDVQPDNVLLDRCGHLKLADFGLAAKISSTGKATAVMPVGRPDYIAPELLKAILSSKFVNHGTPCDFWSLGVVAYELVTLKTPYSDPSGRIIHTYGNIMKADTITYPAEVERAISSDFKELIRCLLNPLPELRYGYLDIIRHAALKNVHWTTLRNEVPPYVPIVSASDDTSNFVELEKYLPIQSLENLTNRNHFSGRNLPFIGFTYTEEADPLPKYDICCNNEASMDSSCHTADGSFNSTTVNMKSVKIKNDCVSLRTKMQHNESLRTKAEATAEELRSQLKSSEGIRSSNREEIVRLILTLEEKTRDLDTLQTNHKMLQETCALLENELMDFEKLSKVQEKHHNELKIDLSGMQSIASEAESRVAMLEDNSCTMAADNIRRLTALREELRSVKEEYAIAATNLYASRDHTATLKGIIIGLREEVATSHRVAASAEAKLTASTEDFRQRELRAQDTIKQHTKLIDFLQAKVEDSSRRKRFGPSNLFRSARDALFPGSSTPVANETNTERSLHREQQQNRELQEQLSLLKHKLSILEENIVMEDKTEIDKKVKTNETAELSGWIRIVNPEGTERSFMTLAGNELKLHSDVPMLASSQLLAQIQLIPKEPAGEKPRTPTLQQIRLTTKLTPENVPTLGETERSFAFMLECPNTVSTWSFRKMVIVCPSNGIREKWLKALFSIIEVADSPPNLNLPQNNGYTPRKVMVLQRRSVSPRCLIEISQGVYLLGAEQGLFSYHAPVTTLEYSKRAFSGPYEPVKISGLDNIFSMKAIHQVNMLIYLCGLSNVTYGNSFVNASCAASGDLWWSDLRCTTSFANRSASLQSSIKPHRFVLPNNERCTRFDVLIGAECTVCAFVEKAIIILVIETSGKGGLVPRRRIKTNAFINAAMLVDHTLMFATGFKVYCLDLKKKKSQVDNFLDQKLMKIYNHRDVIEIILIKKQKAENSPEYLICYNECGVFMDQDGRKSRSEDLKWSVIPIQIVYRQPFLYLFYEKSLHVLGIDNRMCNCDSKSVSTVSLAQEKVVIDITSPKYVGKSLNIGGIIITSTEGPSVSVLEVIGAECYRKDLGISMETLDSVDSMDEDDPIVENWRSIDETADDAISQASHALQSSQSSAEVPHFGSVNKKRAKMPNNKRNAQKPAKSNTDTSSSNGSENETSAELRDEIFTAGWKHIHFNIKH